MPASATINITNGRMRRIARADQVRLKSL